MNCPDRSELLGFLDGAPSEERGLELREHVAQCPLCEGSVQDWRDIIGVAGGLSSDFDGEDLQQLAIAAAKVPRTRSASSLRSSLRAMLVGLAVAVSAVGLLMVLGPSESAAPPQFQERSHVATDLRWAGLQVYDASAVDAPELLTGDRPSVQRFVLAYTNMAQSAYGWLSVVAIDANHRLHRLFPGPGEVAGSIPLERDVVRQFLPEAIRLTDVRGEVRLVALFTGSPLDPETVERAVKHGELRPEWGVQSKRLLVRGAR